MEDDSEDSPGNGPHEKLQKPKAYSKNKQGLV